VDGHRGTQSKIPLDHGHQPGYVGRSPPKYHPRTGFVGFEKFWKRTEHLGLQKSDVKDWYDKQNINQIFKKFNFKSNIPFNVHQPGRIACDLIDLTLYSRKNSGYRFILSCIDMMSRFAWAFPIKKKSPDEILTHLVKLPLEILTVDAGREFMGSVKRYCKENNIKIYLANPRDNTKGRTALVEGFNFSLQRILFKVMKSSSTFENIHQRLRWVDDLDSVVANYNDDKEFGRQFAKDKPIIDNLKIGDNVRILKKRDIYHKGVRNSDWSDEVFSIFMRDGAKYKLLNSDFEIVELSYLPRQLLKVESFSPSHSAQIVKDELDQLKRNKRFIKLQRKTGLNTDQDGNFI
jgi:hypothetical protein